MSFTGFTISSISFDLEIFPDDSCTQLSSNGRDCGGRGNPNQPDLTLLANGSQVAQWFGLTPGSGQNSNGIPASSYTHSPDSGYFDTEQAPQLLGSSGVLGLAGQHRDARFPGLAGDDRDQRLRHQLHAERSAARARARAASLCSARPSSASPCSGVGATQGKESRHCRTEGGRGSASPPSCAIRGCGASTGCRTDGLRRGRGGIRA